MRTLPLLALAAAAALACAPALAAPPALLLEIEAGPMIGMDRLLRGGRAAACMGVEADGIAAALKAALSFDASLGSFFVQAGLVLGLGGRTRLEIGREFPLGSPSLAVAGGRCPLEPLGWPNAFVLAVALGGRGAARDEPRAGTEGASRAGPRLEAAAELSYVAYRVAGTAAAGATAGAAATPGAGTIPEAAGIAGFSAGFRAFLGARLGWLLGRRRTAAAP